MMLIGSLKMELKNGNDVEGQFIARVQVEGVDSTAPRMKLYTVWADSAPMEKAMRAK
jgi:hypothetical protein